MMKCRKGRSAEVAALEIEPMATLIMGSFSCERRAQKCE